MATSLDSLFDRPGLSDGTADVALVQMPFATTSWPSLGLGLLKSALAAQSIQCDVLYFNHKFESVIGIETYSRIANGQPQNCDLLGEWVFSSSGADSGPAYFKNVIFGGDLAHHKEIALEQLGKIAQSGARARALSGAFVSECFESRDWSRYSVVGFTSVFQQHNAALRLADKIKREHPRVRIVFGGANCEGEMGFALLEQYSFVDAVCLGEGDTAFPAYVSDILTGGTGAASGMLIRGDTASVSRPHLDQVRMDDLPYPDFDDFFSQVDMDAHPTDLRILFESSRGCWWGEKSHCTFCGLNGAGIKFRHKSADRSLAELEVLLARYGSYTRVVSATDNIIPHTYFNDFLPRLAALGLDFEMFYETKANLRKQHIALYKNAGLNEIQPGIESLQTDVLKLMRKGVNALQNIRLLKWCSEYDIKVHWNYLYGFPGESHLSYEISAGLVPLLSHLQPPGAIARLRFDRFSPYHNDPEGFGLVGFVPYPAYTYAFPESSKDHLQRSAYHFVSTGEDGTLDFKYVKGLKAAVNNWIDSDNVFLVSIPVDNGTLIVDGRKRSVEKSFLPSPASDILTLLDDIVGEDTLLRKAAELGYGDKKARDILARLESAGLIVREEQSFLGLVIPFKSQLQLSTAAAERLRGSLEGKGGYYRAENVRALCSTAS